jgi:hypothetical protein
MTNTINSAANPDLANKLIQQAINEKPKSQEGEVKITSPSDTLVTLPGGYINDAGEVITEAEVRELNGSDEEAISKAPNLGKAMLTVLQRGSVRVGNEKATDEVLDSMLAGDRDAMVLGIIKATFGPTTTIPAYCSGCATVKDVDVDLNEDIKSKVLTDPINQIIFIVQGKSNVIKVQLPTGVAQRELINNADKTPAELSTVLLEKTILEINDMPVVSKVQVQKLSLADRRLVSAEIMKRVPGPKLEDVVVTCPDCESEVRVPINFGNLFRF